MTKPFYITTPLYYVNAKPHIGHAYTNILCDTFARFHRLLGEEVFFMTGTDEHGTKIDKAARELGKVPKVYVDEMVPQFKELWSILGIEYDYFIRTTDDLHKRVVQNVINKLVDNKDIQLKLYSGWYCIPCESFLMELQLKDKKCPDCGREVQQLSEKNFFFKLSNYQSWLIDHINRNPDFIKPESRRNEMLGFLKQPLEDLCITRPRTRLEWGIPFERHNAFVVYVWFDALINYVSGVGFTTDEKKFKKLWPADVHVVGKDILRHHAVYWPIMLKAMGLEMPHMILAHGWWTMSGAKVSKSRGNAVDPIELVNKYGVDAFRYFLLREVTVGFDGAFSEDLLAERYTSDLANDLGNLWFRLASMLEKYFSRAIPKNTNLSKVDPLIENAWNLFGKVDQAMQQYDPREALAAIWQVVTLCNQFVEEKKPWVLAKDPARKEELAQVLRNLGECVAHVAVLLRSFLPETARKILERLHLPIDWDITNSKDFAKPFLEEGVTVERGDALFPRLDEEKKSVQRTADSV